MRTCRIATIPAILFLLFVTACGGGGGTNSSSSSSGSGSGSNGSGSTTPNSAQLIVDAGPANNSTNEAFTTVTVCVPNTTTCQQIDHIQVDTGSSGLRIISSLLTINLQPSTTIAECLQFVDMSFLWGPLATADVKIAGEAASSVPIQLVNPQFQTVPSSCSSSGGTSVGDVASLGANGILGVSMFRYDCGPACAQSAPTGAYYKCSSGTCQPTALALTSQVQNPVWLFPTDNNGVILRLPAISDSGATSVNGQLIFGIGTQSDNALGNAAVLQVGSDGQFSANFNGTPYNDSSVIDSGSNGYFFLNSQTLTNTYHINMPDCSSGNSFYCPASLTTIKNLNVIGQTSSGTPTGTAQAVTFNIVDPTTLSATVVADPDIGGSIPAPLSWDFGLPFFFGKTVFTAIETNNTGTATGAYVAFQ